MGKTTRTEAPKQGEIRNRLAEFREKRGLAAAALAERVGVSRQTIYAMEAGSYVPNTAVALRLARTLQSTVEELFELEAQTPPAPRTEEIALLGAEPPQPGQPVQLCHVGGKLIGLAPASLPWRFPLADGVIAAQGTDGKTRVQLFDPDQEFGNRVLVAGCDPGISIFGRHVQRSGVELVVAHRNSSQALALLEQGAVHAAGCHIHDESNGESNLPAVRALFPEDDAAVISFAVWEEGLVVARSNPKGIHGISDLGRRDVRIVNREAGAGSRMLLDSRLREEGIEPGQVTGYTQTALGHLPAAWQVANGQADCCLATRAAARLFGLDFVPLIAERYDFVIHRRNLTLPAVQIFLDVLNRAAFRRELEAVGGYDARNAGARLL